MKKAGWTIGRRRTRARGALGLFAAVWLNLTLAPCAMAYGAADDHDCPHCPPQHEMPGHHDMHSGMHESADDEMPCADGFADCALDGAYSHDARNGQSKLKDTDFETPPAVVDVQQMAHYARPNDVHALPGDSTAPPGVPRPIHLLNCVFLD